MLVFQGTAEGTREELRWRAEGRSDPHGRRVRASPDQGQQGHLSPGGVRGQVHVYLHEVCRGNHGWILKMVTH